MPLPTDDRAKFEAINDLISAAMAAERELGANAGVDESHSAWQALKSAERRVIALASAQHELSVGGPEVNNPCGVCGVLRSRHGTYPTCATHHYSPITTPAPAVAPAAQSAETAWANLPAALKAHPGIKALYRAALASQKGA